MKYKECNGNTIVSKTLFIMALLLLLFEKGHCLAVTNPHAKFGNWKSNDLCTEIVGMTKIGHMGAASVGLGWLGHTPCNKPQTGLWLKQSNL